MTANRVALGVARAFALLAMLLLLACAGAESEPSLLEGKAQRLRQDLSANDTLARALSQRQIVNVHEHIQSLDELKALEDTMNETGIAKTLLMGSSWFTITLNPKYGFSRIDKNNAILMRVVARAPDRFEAWPTVDPRDPEMMTKIQALVAAGASGVKLYLGHGFVSPLTEKYLFHLMALDDPRMLALFAWCEENFIPLMFHVNPYKPGFAEEFIAVLRAYPDLKVIAPHFILSSIRSTRLEEFLDTFPNLYSDISFGHDDFLVPGLERISKDPEKFKRLFRKYPKRFMYGTDLVVTEAEHKNVDWLSTRFLAYLAMLGLETYEVPFVPDRRLRGLALSSDLLEGILFRNYQDFRALRPQGTEITRQVDWSRMGVPRTGRSPGTTIPANPAAVP